MTIDLTARIPSIDVLKKENTATRQVGRIMFMLMMAALSVVLAACQTPSSSAPAVAQADSFKQPEVLTIKEGDVLKISFPGASSLDTTQQVRRDGRITLPTGEEIVVTGMTSAGLEQSLIKRYASQLVSKEVVVAVTASSFEVYVSGMVLHPGKIQSDHPLSALEAIMEAGGFDIEKADIQKVEVIRNEVGKTKNYVINLKLVLEGKQNEPFYLKPSDIVYVPEKFSWF